MPYNKYVIKQTNDRLKGDFWYEAGRANKIINLPFKNLDDPISMRKYEEASSNYEKGKKDWELDQIGKFSFPKKEEKEELSSSGNNKLSYFFE